MTLCLNDVLGKCSEISNFKPSQSCARISRPYIRIDGDLYEIRMFSYRVKDDIYKDDISGLSFKRMIDKYGDRDMVPTIYDNGYGPIHTFVGNSSLNMMGIYFLLPLRRVNIDELIDSDLIIE